MAKKPFAPSPEVLALLAADRTELATTLFITAFTPLLDESYPKQTVAQLARTLAEMWSVRVNKRVWNSYGQPEAVLARLVLELALIWERVGLACRAVVSESTGLTLLLRGESLLRGADRVTAVRQAMRTTSA